MNLPAVEEEEEDHDERPARAKKPAKMQAQRSVILHATVLTSNRGNRSAAGQANTTGRKKASKAGYSLALDPDEQPVNCVCGVDDSEDAGRHWVLCDTCLSWKHTTCEGVKLKEVKDSAYQCTTCRDSAM